MIRERGEGDRDDVAMTKGEYDALRDADPRPWPERTVDVSHLIAALRDAPDETWRNKAACKGMPDMFFPHDRDKSNYTRARKVCAGCPVRAECAEAGVDEVHGMWGGMSPRERARARRNQRQRNGREHSAEVRREAERLIVAGWEDRHVARSTRVPQRTILDWRRALGIVRGPGGRQVA